MYGILVNYIENAIAEGRQKSEIKKTLIASGYASKDVATAFSMFDQQSTNSPVSAPPFKAPEISRNKSPLAKLLAIEMTRKRFIIAVIAYAVITNLYSVYVYSVIKPPGSTDNSVATVAVTNTLIFIVMYMLSIFIVIRRLDYMRRPSWWLLFYFIPLFNLGLIMILLFGYEGSRR